MDYLRTDINLKRIHDPAYFERYFSLLKNESDISEKQFKEFMQRPDLRYSILTDAIKFGLMKNLLKRLKDNAIITHFPTYEYDIVETIIIFFNSHPTEFETYSNTVSDAIINLICCTDKKDEFIKKFFLSFKENNSYPNIIRIYFFHYIRIFVKDNRSFGGRHYEFDTYYKNNYEKIWQQFSKEFKNTASAFLEKKYTLNCPFIKFLYIVDYAELFPEDYLIYQKDLTKDIEFLIYILSQFIRIGDDLSLIQYDFRYKDLLFPDNLFHDFFVKIKSLDKSEYNKQQQAYIDHFLKINIEFI